MAGVKSVPFTAMTMRWPRPWPWAASSKMSSRSRGSPPVRITTDLAHGGQVVKQLKALGGAELAGIRPGPRRGPAVETGQVAAPGDLPGQEAQGRDFSDLWLE